LDLNSKLDVVSDVPAGVEHTADDVSRHAGRTAILVAGGAGYIGSHTAKLLSNSQYLPVVVDNLITGNHWALRFGPYAIGSIADRSLVLELVKKYRIGAAILFAAHAYVGESVENPSKYYRNNLSASLEFLEALLEAGIKRLVFSSSCSIYGEQQSVPINEDSRMNPLSPYAETKVALENVLRWYDQAFELRSVSLRYFNAAGACASGDLGEHHDPETHLIPRTISAAMGNGKLSVFGYDYPTPDGSAVRDYVHVTDLADAHVRALEYLLQGNGSAQFNCGSGVGTSVNEVIHIVEQVSGRKAPVERQPRRQGDAPVLIADLRRIGKVLGWQPRYSSIDTIVATAWRWHSEAGARWVAPDAHPAG
jgi:UDP-arabinose 4-epimerase